MIERRNSSTELILAGVAALLLAGAGVAWNAATADSVVALRQRLAAHPDDGAVRNRLVDKLLESRQAREAVDLLLARNRLHPEDAAARDRLVEVLAASNRSAEAAGILQKRVEAAPSDVQARQRLAELMLELNQPDKAIALYRQVLAAMPQSTSAPYGMARAFVLKHDELTAQQILEQSLKNHPDDPASNTLLADLAIKSMGTDAYPAAQKLYEKALAGEPTRIDAAMSLARIYVAQGRTLDAAKALRRPAAADRRTAALHLFYADILAELRAYDLASAEYNTGTANDPNNAEAFYRWGKALATAAPQAAEKRLRNAIALNQEITPRTKEVKERAAEYHVQLGLVQRNLADLGLGYTDYEKEFAAAIDADPFYANTYLEFARLQLKDGHEGTAVNWINDALHVAPGNTEAKRALAKILLNSKDPMRRDPEKAIALLSEAVAETQSRDLQVLVDLVNALSGQGRYDDALRQMDVVIPEAAARQIAGWQMELLRSMRAELYLALVPTQEGGEPRFGVEGRHVHEPGDDPLPPVPQPDLYDTLRLSLDLSKPPGPGSVMDPVFLGEEYQREKARRDASGLQLMALPR